MSMSKEERFQEKLERLSRADQRFILEYKDFEEKIRQHEQSIFGGSLEDHLLSVKRKPIGTRTEEGQISAVLAYHDWVCSTKQLVRYNAYVSLPEVLVSYDNLYHYCKMRVEELGLKVYSQHVICIGILRKLQFMEADEQLDEEMKGEIATMKDKTQILVAAAQRELDKFREERPSVDELREKGEMLSITDLAKVCQKQASRVEVLVNNHNRTKQTRTREVVGKMLPKEILRLAVISMLLKMPLRRTEFESFAIDMTTRRWRLKLSAEERKSGYSINKTLSRREMGVFELLWKTKHSQDDDWAEASTWQPFKGMDTGRILKATTLDIAGVEVNNKSLRIAAESYADQVGSA
eukprot:scaffold17461_cov148-Skeletonema_marinoi.AAC.1